MCCSVDWFRHVALCLLDDEEILHNVCKGFNPVVKEGYGAWFPAHIDLSASAKDFLAKTLEMDPACRMSAQEALEHPWSVLRCYLD